MTATCCRRVINIDSMIFSRDWFFNKGLVKSLAIYLEIIVKLFKLGHVVQIGPITNDITRRLDPIIIQRLVDFHPILNVPLLLKVIDNKGLTQPLIGYCLFQGKS